MNERALCCNCFAVGAYIERFHGGGWKRENECAEMAEKRRDDEQKEETEKERKEKKRINKGRETDKRRGRINSKVGEGAFSDEIRSHGRSEFGYLIHEGAKNGWNLKGRVTAGRAGG